MQATLVLLVGIAYVATYEVADPTVKKVILDVYYEPICGPCHWFILHQLKPTYQALSEYMEANLVPIQFDPPPYLITLLHVCTLARVKGDKLQRVLLASCLFEYYWDKTKFNATVAGKKCSIKFGLKWSEVSTCATGQEGQALVKKYWDEAESLKPPIVFVPQIAVNKYRGNMHFQYKVHMHLEKVVCSILAKEKVTPAACVNKTISYPDLLNQMN